MKALITGASSGMGRDMANYLASFGYDLIVVSRDKKKLDELFNDLNVSVKKIEMDLSITDNCIKLHKMLKDENIDILINNAGFGDAGNFSETSLDKELNMIDLNIKAYHILTKLFLKDFIKKDYGRILNVASMAGFMPGPYMATYYATKNYVVSLSLAIYEELKKDNSNVKISIFCPGPVDTNFNNVAEGKFNIHSMKSETVAKYAVEKFLKGKFLIIPGILMKIMKVLSKISPNNLTSKIVWYVH